MTNKYRKKCSTCLAGKWKSKYLDILPHPSEAGCLQINKQQILTSMWGSRGEPLYTVTENVN
jgi:hypothetical protein